ncbi:MAG: heavy-metal-associated domain-containing protein [Chloroflexota bacterium]
MEGETIEHVRLTSPDISDDGDRGKLEALLSPLAGVRDVQVTPPDHAVEVTFDPRVINTDRFAEVMQENGYGSLSRHFARQRDQPSGSS